LNKSITLQSSGWYTAQQKVGAFRDATGKVSSTLTPIGDTMTTHVTAPIVAGFAYAASKSINFKNTMNEVKNLLVTSGESTKQAIAGVKNMESDALTYSNKYGVSQQKIAEGYEELVKRGYTSKQALGAMKSELQAAKASGDDFNDVVGVTSSTLESFGMKANTTAGMTRNTKTAVNELAYAADATSTDFQSLGVGMSYVGSTAHQAGFSLAETSAAMGVLSNNGLEADKAGTGLRKVINSLVSPTKNGTAALKELGLKTSDFVDKSGKMKSMTDIFQLLNSHMKDLTSTQRQDVFHALFGTTGQTAGIILSKNTDQLGKLTQKVKEAADGQGYVAKLSKKNMQSAKNQLAVLKESLTNLGMTMANDVIPAIMPLVKDVDNLVVKFSHLSKGTQENIVKWVAFAAAAGPVIGIVGRISGAAKGLASVLFGTIGGINRMVSAAKLGGTGMQVLKSAFSSSAYSAAGFAGAAGTAGGAATELGAAGGEAAAGISLLNPVVLGVTATVVAGAAVWEIWGKKAYESQQRTNKWGSDVGQQADSALTKFQGFSSKAGSSLTDFEKASHTSTKSVSKDFGDMYSDMQKDSQNTISQMKKDMQGLPSSVQTDLKKDVKQRQKYNAEVLSDAKESYTNAETILKAHNGKMSDLSDTERAALLNDQQQMNEDEIKLLKLNGSKKKNILAALNGDISNMTRNQRNTTINELTSSMQKENKLYNDQKSKIDSMYSKGEISSKQYAQALKDLQTVHKSTTDGMAAAILKLDKANGASKSQIEQDLLNVGYTYKQAAAIVKQQNANMANSTSLVVAGVSNMNGKVKTAAQAWNSLVFDPKTGKVKTNAQDEVNKAVQSKNQWNQIQLLERKGKMSSNAKAMVADALLQTGKWDSLSFKQQKAWIQTNAGTEIYKALSANGKWNTMSFAAKEAVINAKGLPQLANAIVKYNLWNDLPTKVKELLATDKTASATLKNAGINVDSYNSKNPKHKVLTGDSSNVDNASSKGKNSINSFNSTAPLGKRFQGNSSSVDSASSSGRSSVTRFRDTSPGGSKSLRARDNASGPASSARSAVLQFSWLGDHTVTLTTVKRTVHEVVNKVSSFFGNLFATGTEDAPEGMAVLGDGGRNEPYLTPSGSLGISPNVPTPYYLERGTRVWPSIQAFKQDIPHYANGTLGHNGAVNTLLEARPTISKMADTNVTFNSNNADVVAVLQQQMTLQKSQIALLSRLLNAATSPSSTQNNRSLIRSISQQINSLNVDQKRGSLA
jgi:TP901 family phage tail tape measure protein